MHAADAAIRAVAAAGVSVEMIAVDLSLLADAARAATQIATSTDRIDVLINNAGGTSKQRAITAEGNEATFAGNHLGHFVLTHRLLPLLRAAAARSQAGATRVLNVSSSGHQISRGLNWDDLQSIEHFVPMAAYCNVKLANILFTRALAERVAEEGIVAHAMHPGAVDSNFVTHADENTQRYLRGRKDLVTPEQAADTLVWLATANEAGKTNGDYFYQRQSVPTSAAANDMEAARRLWLESEKLAARALTGA
jgi:NAD(P)-dependent dehydrogenase (short-subunit alcohol dehydrogenase family)